MTRQQAIAAAPQSQTAYWNSIIFFGVCAALIIVLSIKMHNWKEPQHVAVWPLYLLSLMSILMLLQSAERLAFPVRTALRSRALNMKFGRRISAVSIVLTRILFVLAIGAFAYHFVKQNGSGNNPFFGLWGCGSLLNLFTADLLGYKFVDATDDYEHSPPLTNLQPLHSDHWGAPHTR